MVVRHLANLIELRQNCILLGLEPAESPKSVIFGMNLPQRGMSDVLLSTGGLSISIMLCCCTPCGVHVVYVMCRLCKALSLL